MYKCIGCGAEIIAAQRYIRLACNLASEAYELEPGHTKSVHFKLHPENRCLQEAERKLVEEYVLNEPDKELKEDNETVIEAGFEKAFSLLPQQ